MLEIINGFIADITDGIEANGKLSLGMLSFLLGT